MAIDYSVLAQPKPTPRRLVKARKKRQFAKDRKSCRAARYAKDGGCCQRCGRHLVLNPTDARHEFEIANIHEIRFRSRGGSATDVSNTQTLCAFHHAEAHGRMTPLAIDSYCGLGGWTEGLLPAMEFSA